MRKKIAEFFGKKVFSTIKSVPTNVPKTEKEKALSKLAIQRQKTKGSGAKLKQTLFESQNKAFKGNDFTFATTNKKTPSNKELKKKKEDDEIAKEFGVRFKNAKGGRVGLKRGTGLMQKKSNIQKIKETFGPKKNNPKMSKAKKKFPDLTGDGKVTFADVLKGRGVINGKKKKKKI